jgi:hypothetical protein
MRKGGVGFMVHSRAATAQATSTQSAQKRAGRLLRSSRRATREKMPGALSATVALISE